MLRALGMSGDAGIAHATTNAVVLSVVDSRRRNPHLNPVSMITARLKQLLLRHSECRSAISGGR